MVKRVYYDPEADILYILLRKSPVEDTVEAAEDIFMELDEKGEVIDIEIWHVSKNILELLSQAIAAKIKQQPENKPQRTPREQKPTIPTAMPLSTSQT